MTARALAPSRWLAIDRGRAAILRAAGSIEAAPAVPILAGFVVVEWIAVLATALTVRHNGWVYYQGGDQLWYYTIGWLLGHGQLTQTPVGYGWSLVLTPIARLAGPDLVSAFPAIVLFDVLVLMPIAMLALYGIAARIGGRLFGYWALLLWVVLPFIGVLYTNQGYHQKYTELLLPQAFGLTGMADYPSMVAALVSVYFCARVLFDEAPLLVHGVAAGVAAGVAIAVKPSAAIFLVGPALALLYRRRTAAVGAVLAGVAPAVVALGVWKERGLGNLPLLSGHGAAPPGTAAAAPLAGLNLGHYWHQLDWSRFLSNLDLLREHFWSGRLIEWIVIAGVIALARRSLTAALLIGGWFLTFAIVKGSYGQASIEDGSTLRIMMPAFPAFLLLIAALPLLLPHAPAKLRAWRPALPEPPLRLRWGLVGAVVLLSALLPIGAFAAASRSGSLDPATLNATSMAVPTNVDLGLTATKRRGKVVLAWKPQHPLGGPVFYRVWRNPSTDTLTCPPPTAGGRICKLVMPEVGTTHVATFTDAPKPGRWVYRVAVAANWLNDAGYGDPYFVSRPVSVTVR